MKIRDGFVSNSSSSSFCILGCKFTDEIRDRFLELASDDAAEKYREYEDSHYLVVGHGLFQERTCRSIGGRSLGHLIGTAIDGDPTVNEVREKAVKLANLLGDQDFRIYSGEYSC